jgi:hypothetical protein
VNGRLRVDRADPEVMMSHELFRELLVSGMHPDIEYVPGPDGAHQGALIKVHAINGTFIYRIEKFIDHDRGWLCAWPD